MLPLVVNGPVELKLAATPAPDGETTRLANITPGLAPEMPLPIAMVIVQVALEAMQSVTLFAVEDWEIVYPLEPIADARWGIANTANKAAAVWKMRVRFFMRLEVDEFYSFSIGWMPVRIQPPWPGRASRKQARGISKTADCWSGQQGARRRGRAR